MTRLAVSVEGQTDEEFVKQVLADHLRARDVESTPIVLGRARGRSGGGKVSSDRLVSEMACLYHSFDVVTSLVDFYGFRDKGDRTAQELETYLAGRVAETVGRTWDERRALTPRRASESRASFQRTARCSTARYWLVKSAWTRSARLAPDSTPG